MYHNAFTPAFGGKPDFFFGRADALARFDRALVDRGSDWRALFITATRGMGKTALLEQLSLKARGHGWRVIDLGPENTVTALVRALTAFDEETKTTAPQLSVNVLGSGLGVGGMSVSRTRHYDEADLDSLFLRACADEHKGIMVTLDEAQKVPEADVSALCGAFQMASRKGLNAILVIAGLPYAYESIIHYRGCTYMRRAAHERLTLLRREEVAQAFEVGIGESRGLSLKGEALDRAVSASYGHPYLVQLIGYYLVSVANDHELSGRHALSDQDVDGAVALARGAYEERALQPMLAELTPGERAFLAAMSEVLDVERVARTSDVARRLGRTPKQLSSVRDALLKYGVIVVPARGQLMFAVPLLASFVARYDGGGDEVGLLREWGA